METTQRIRPEYISVFRTSEHTYPNVNWTLLTPKYPEISRNLSRGNGNVCTVICILVPWKPTDVLNFETLDQIYQNNRVTPNIEIFPEFTEGVKSMSGRCGFAGNGCLVSRLSRSL